MTSTTVIGVEKSARYALLISGAIAIIFGIIVFAWPDKAAVAITGVIAVYAVIAGLLYVAMGVTSSRLETGGRVGHVLLGLLYVVAGGLAFSSLQQSAVFLTLFITIMVGVMWIIEGFTALFTLSQSNSTALTIVFAVVSVLAGFVLLSSPVWGAAFLWWFLALSLIVLGVLNVIRALSGAKN